MRGNFFLATGPIWVSTNMFHTLIPELISRILSLLQASTLRDRYYTLEQRVEVLETAIDDIRRINARSSTPNPLIEGICSNTQPIKKGLSASINS